MLDKDHRGSENWRYHRGRRILVLEDDPIIAVDWYFQLKRRGVTPVLAPTNQLGLQHLVRHNVDAAIVDCCTLRHGCCTLVLELLTARHIPFNVISGDAFAMRRASIDAPALSRSATPAEVWPALSEVLH